MRGVDLNVFDFDYDVTWTALFLTAEGEALGRYGSVSAESGKPAHSLAGLRYALEQALVRHRSEPAAKAAPAAKPQFAEDYPAAARLQAKACIHCHNVYEFRRQALQTAG